MRTLVTIFAAAALTIGVSMAMPPEMLKSWQSLERRAEAGDSDAQWRMAGVLERGFDTIAPDTTRAMQLVRSAAEAGHPAAMNYLGYLYGEGVILPQSADSSIYWLGKAAATGDAKGAYNLAYRLLPDTTALPWLRKAVAADLPQARVLMGNLMAEGRIVRRDSAAASALYSEALASGLRDAQLHLLN
ncbi:MAG: sel1 repeat family protein, partial [Muribaculaceae bacterium]|nr:sel1 repeat family protein [Muribaculaceae bacterium]